MNQKIANELLDMAESLTAKDTYMANEILRFIKANKAEIENDEYALIKLKLTGPKIDTKWMNIQIDDLERIAKVLK